MSIKSACIVAQIGVTTLAEWREEHAGLKERLIQARELARQKALRAIQAAGDRDWRANVEWLKLAFASDYRGNTRVDVTANAQASAVIVTDEQRHDLMEQRRRALEGSAPNIPVVGEPSAQTVPPLYVVSESQNSNDTFDEWREA